MNKLTSFISIFVTAVFAAVVIMHITGTVPEIIKGSPGTGSRIIFGLSAVEENVRKIDVLRQTELTVRVLNGNIKIKGGEESSISIVEKRKIKGPATVNKLKEMLEAISTKEIAGYAGVYVDFVQDEELPLFYGIIYEVGLTVPSSIKNIRIITENGNITVSDLKNASTINLSTEKGKIEVKRCSGYKLQVQAENGGIFVEDFEGSCSYECGRGNISLNNISGKIELKLASGITEIVNAVSNLDCTVYSGKLTIADSLVKSGSNLYVSHGEIAVEMQNVEGTGKYSAKAANGKISVMVPRNIGYSLIARSVRGRIYNHFDPEYKLLQTLPDGYVYGDVAGGGCQIDVYTDIGDIVLY